jgi:hypothetical protein
MVNPNKALNLLDAAMGFRKQAFINIEARAIEATRKSMESAVVVPLSAVKGEYNITPRSVFLDHNKDPSRCATRKFRSIEHIEEALKGLVPAQVYLFELKKLIEFDMDLQSIGEYYNLRYCIKASVK